MSAGDNFDTTREGETSYKTKRHTGHFPLHQTYMSGKDYAPQYYKSDDNLGHPCNAGCGCKEVCDPNLTATGETGCLLPPELTIRVAQASSRQGARDKFEKEYFLSQIKRFNGNMLKISEITGMERTALYRKIKSLNIDLNKN